MRSGIDLVIMWLHDNAIYCCLDEFGRAQKAEKLAGKYHCKGDNGIITGSEVTELNFHMLPIIREAGDTPCVVIGPLPRYITGKCCEDTTHVVNFGRNKYGSSMLEELGEVQKKIRSFIGGRKLDNLHVVRPAYHMGMACTNSNDPNDMLRVMKDMWGPDPVHPAP